MLMLSWISSLAWAVDCAEPITMDELNGGLALAESAYAELDDERFRDAVNELAGLMLPCVGDALPTELAARYHRVMAIHLFTIGDRDKADLSMMAAKAAEPDYSFDDTLLPPSHDLRAEWDVLEVSEAGRKVPEPKIGSVSFDGHMTRRRSTAHPTIAQLFDESGLAQSTHYLAPRESLPPYKAIPRTRNALIACSGGALALSATSYGLAWRSNAKVFSLKADPTVKGSALDASRASANAWTFVSGALFGAAAGCATGAGVVGQR
jgi:hypothetical protein